MKQPASTPAQVADDLVRLGRVNGIEVDAEALHRYLVEIVEAAGSLESGDPAVPLVVFDPSPSLGGTR